MATHSTPSQPFPERAKQYRIASRGMPAAVRARTSLLSSMAARMPPSESRAAAESCASPESPKMFTKILCGRPKGERQRAVYPDCGCVSTRRARSAAALGEDRATGEQPAKAQQQQTRLAQGEVPEHPCGFVACVLA